MNIKFIDLISKGKVGLLISFILSTLLTSYIYIVEDRFEIYESTLSIAKPPSIYENVLRNSVSNVSELGANSQYPCLLDFSSDKIRLILKAKFKISESIRNKKKFKEKTSERCKEIILISLNHYLDYNKKVINHLDNTKINERNEGMLLDLSFSNSQRIFYLKYIIQDLNNSSLTFVKTYAPASLRGHFVNGILMFIILSALYLGFVFAKNNNINSKRKRK